MSNLSRNALLVGSANCKDVLGVNWRWLRDHAPALGLSIARVGPKGFVDAKLARDAILAQQSAKPDLSENSQSEGPEDLESMRKRLGLRRRSA